jgi:hypothetical protein
MRPAHGYVRTAPTQRRGPLQEFGITFGIRPAENPSFLTQFIAAKRERPLLSLLISRPFHYRRELFRFNGIRIVFIVFTNFSYCSV